MPDDPYEELRAYPRIIPSLFLQLVDARTGDYFGDVMNIAGGGMRVSVPERINSGGKLMLRMDMGTEILGQQILDFLAQVRWCRFDADIGSYQCGLHYDSMTQEELALLEYLTENYRI